MKSIEELGNITFAIKHKAGKIVDMKSQIADLQKQISEEEVCIKAMTASLKNFQEKIDKEISEEVTGAFK